MSTVPVVAFPRPRTRRRVDLASVSLLKSVMSDTWRPDQAADDLLARVHDDRRVLRLMRARLSRAMLDRPTRIIERAAITLDHALSRPVEGGGVAFIPGQQVRHA